MKKFTVSALCCVAACAFCLGGCNKNADKMDSCSDKAACADKASCSDKSSCSKSASGEAPACCKNKAAQTN